MGIDLTTTDAAKAAWAPVEAQLSAEGAAPGSDAWQFAKAQFANELNGLAARITDPGEIPTVAKSAAELVQGSWTIAGNVAHVAALISGASQQPPAQLIASTTGILIGIMAAVAPETAGIGSAIVAGLGIALSMLGQAGLLGGPPKGKEICPGVFVDPPPDWVVGCVGFTSPAGNGQPIGDAVNTVNGGNTTPNPLWQRFPEATVATPFGTATSSWFQTGYMGRKGPWSRKVDVAWPQWAWLEWDDKHPDPQLADFQRAYLTAWKANAERAMNGQKAVADEVVLAHVLRVWNHAHASAGAADVTLTQQDLPDWSRLQDPPKHGPYVASLIRALQGQGLTDTFGLSGAGAVVHMGARRDAKPVAVKPIPVHLGHFGAAVAKKPIVAPLVRPIRDVFPLVTHGSEESELPAYGLGAAGVLGGVIVGAVAGPVAGAITAVAGIASAVAMFFKRRRTTT